MPRLIDITGQRFGRLLVVSKAASLGKNTRWACLCDCGRTTEVFKSSITSGAQTSCGCFQKEVARRTVVKRATTHGLRHSSEYSVWCGIKRRCENKNDKSYLRYGGAGIEVRYENFEDFLSDVGRRPGADFSVDRIDPSGHYERGNVRWADQKTQARNKNNTFYVILDGKRVCLADACERLGLNYKSTWKKLRGSPDFFPVGGLFRA